MNRFFRGALFPLVIIGALVWLALQTLGSHGQKTTQATTYDVYHLVQTDASAITQPVTIDPTKQAITVVTATKTYSVHYATPQSEAAFEQALLRGCSRSTSGRSPPTTRWATRSSVNCSSTPIRCTRSRSCRAVRRSG